MGVVAHGGRGRGASKIQGRLGGVRRGEDVWEGSTGTTAYTQGVCTLWRLALGSEGEMGGVCGGPSASPPPLPLPHLIQVKPPGSRASPRMVDGGELQRLPSGGFRTENIRAPAAKAGPPSGQQLAGGQWPGSLCPTVACRTFTLSLGIRGLCGGGSVGNIPLGPWVFPCPKTAWCPPHPCWKFWALPAYPELPGRPGEEIVLCDLPKPCVPSPWVLAVARGSSTSIWDRAWSRAYGETPDGRRGVSRSSGSAWSRRERGSDSSSAT